MALCSFQLYSFQFIVHCLPLIWCYVVWITFHLKCHTVFVLYGRGFTRGALPTISLYVAIDRQPLWMTAGCNELGGFSLTTLSAHIQKPATSYPYAARVVCRCYNYTPSESPVCSGWTRTPFCKYCLRVAKFLYYYHHVSCSHLL
jgi:hypothetical protein